LGEGTEILSHKRPGEYLDIIGPLGKGFDFQLHASGCRLHLLVAGGIGVAPLTFLAEKLAEVKSQKSKVKTLVLIGARIKDQVLCEKDFRDLGCSVKIATDDGSHGFKGKITELLEEILVTSHKSQVTSHRSATCNLRPATIYACGPRPMLKEITAISKQHNIGTQISLEEHMACGIGVCLGCVVNTKKGFQRVCKEGPVFNADEIIW